MRKNFEKDEPDPHWTDAELLAWVKKHGAQNETDGIGDQDQSFPGVSSKTEKSK